VGQKGVESGQRTTEHGLWDVNREGKKGKSIQTEKFRDRKIKTNGRGEDDQINSGPSKISSVLKPVTKPGHKVHVFMEHSQIWWLPRIPQMQFCF